MIYSRQLNYLDLIIKNGKMPHAFLFYGRDAEYKSNLAKSCVFRLNSPGSKWEDFLPSNTLAQKIIKESHPDLFIVRRQEDKKEIAISQIRALKDFVSKTPIDLKLKSAIIEDAEFLNEESWNALLKTLEEPSGNTVIFILSSGISAIPKTAISRTVSVPFFNADNSKRRHGAKNDIILRKLEGARKTAIFEKFDLAEKIASSGDPIEILDEWLLDLRTDILENPSRDLSKTIEKIIYTKNVLASTNANQKLVLENLLLQIE